MRFIHNTNWIFPVFMANSRNYQMLCLQILRSSTELENILEVVSTNKETISSSLSSNQTELTSANKEIDLLEGVSQYIANLRQNISDINSEIQAIRSRMDIAKRKVKSWLWRNIA